MDLPLDPVIVPIVGDRLWYWPTVDQPEATVRDEEQACSATVIYVNSPQIVHLQVTDQIGNTFTRKGVRLHPGDVESRPRDAEVATRIPRQRVEHEGV